MNYLYTFIIIVAYNLTTAQDLYVSNTYIYVDGTAFTSGPTVAPLFVTNDINLAGANSYLYLRNDAQLLQGNSVGNSGTGQLSVFQTGNSNTYMYNYWGSPVGLTDGAITGNTSLRPNNNLYRETAAPITSTPYLYVAGYDGTATQIASYWLYTFIGLPSTTNPYEDWIGLGGGSLPVGGDPNGTLASGYGFTMKGNPTGTVKYDFRGRPNNGTISATVNANRETLVGNPFPSALDAYYFIHDPMNYDITGTNPPQITGVLKYWQQAPGASSHNLSDYVGGYALYTIGTTSDNGTPLDLTDDSVTESFTPAVFHMYLLDGTIASGPPITNSMPKIAHRYIPIGQGFMVEGTASATNVTFNNSQRVFYKQSDPDSEFFRTSENSSSTLTETEYNEDGYNIVPEDFKRFRINVGFNNNGIESYTRQLLMNFHHTATDGFDYGLEAQISEQVSSDANWVLDGVPYVIQAFDYDMELKIPLVVNLNNQQVLRFGIYDVQNFDESQPIFIHDIQNDIYVDLRENAYEINLPQGNYTDRFEITFTSEALNIEQVITSEDLNIFQNNQLSQLTIFNPKLLEIKQVRLYDVTGKQILDARNLKAEANYSFSTKNLSQGVYIANVTFADNQAVSKKIVVSNK